MNRTCFIISAAGAAVFIFCIRPVIRKKHGIVKPGEAAKKVCANSFTIDKTPVSARRGFVIQFFI